ncbi:MAG: hypothetical protein DMG70_08230 [Acidobacteria bacterium]|nr:MAG: hypothetical protein DMG70_08230 [Acidobacteriota bacterium]PYY11028.1 MAG: hypothetical protein DMG69_04970 [Acidobacteriota bacterium]
MKKTGLILTLLAATVAWAQQADPAAVAGATTPEASSSDSAPADSATPVETSKNYPQVQFATPTYADLYCAGFITKQLLPNANYVAGGLQTPNTTKYVSGDIVYLAGQGYQPGAEYTIVRELRDVNEFEAYPGQHRLVAATGQPYAELGRVKILDTRNKTAVAQVEYSCDAILPGDTAIPFAEKPAVTYRPPDKFDRFAPGSGRTSGRIVLAKDFDAFVGTGGKVYMNVGANQGVKVGDYYRATRPYTDDLHDPVDSLSFKAGMGDDTQKKPPAWKVPFYERTSYHSGPTLNPADLPHRAVGEIIIISVTPTTATGMITFALEDVHIGDDVELDGEAQP